MTRRVALREFLLRHRLCAEAYDWEEALSSFLREMDAVRAGAKGSLKMIPMRLDVPELPEAPVSVTAIDVGGTNVRASVVTLDRTGMLDCARLPAFRTPGVGRRITRRDFFATIAAGVGEQLNTGRIGICFSLAANPLPDGDAVVAAGAKQLDVQDLLGSRVGAGFREAASALGLPCGQRIVVVNDTVAAALGGKMDAGRGRYSGFIGFIYGTGTNIAYREPSGAIINVESGAYCGFPTGDIDDLYDQGHIDIGCDRFEKMVSGGYQGGLMTLVLKTAEAEGLLTPRFSERLAGALGERALGSPDISAFCDDPAGSGCISAACLGEADARVVADICRAMTGRSALLCSVTITAALLRAEIGRTPAAPAFITAEGSTYLKQTGFREALDDCMAKYAKGLHYEFHPVTDAVMNGTAIAALNRG